MRSIALAFALLTSVAFMGTAIAQQGPEAVVPADEGTETPADPSTPQDATGEATQDGAAPVEGEEAADETDGDEATAGDAPQFTAEQVERGTTAYNSNCAACHGNSLSNGAFGPPLAGDNFLEKWGGQSVADLYNYAHTRMPPTAPGSLPEQTYADIVSYILQTNGMEPMGEELPADTDVMDEMVIQ